MLKDLILSEKTKGTIAIAAAVVMYFTPDHIDAIIEAGLAAFGISKFVIKREDE
jgi:O-methyltransferase involved in polyketide biosynthesis